MAQILLTHGEEYNLFGAENPIPGEGYNPFGAENPILGEEYFAYLVQGIRFFVRSIM